MKIVVDTNVMISATFWNGDSNRILEKVEQNKVELFSSKEILEEFAAVLGYKEIQEKIKDKKLEAKRTVEKVTLMSKIVEPNERFTVILNDPDDDKFLDCAVAGKVDFIVSQNKHLLKLKEFQGIKIVSAAEFVKML